MCIDILGSIISLYHLYNEKSVCTLAFPALKPGALGEGADEGPDEGSGEGAGEEKGERRE